jgi:hypothetical protein
MFTGKLCLVVCLSAFAQQKEVKDAREYELYNAVVKDFTAKDFSKALPDLDAWKQAYPESAFKVERECMYVQAFGDSHQPEKTIAAASAVIASGAKIYPPDLLRVLFLSVTAIRQMNSATAYQMEFAESAAQRLKKFEKPDNVTAEAWTKASAELRAAADDALLYIEISRSAAARNRNDCPAAEAAAHRAMDVYPDSVQAAWYLGMADLCLQKSDPKRAPAAIWAFARAAAIDPAKGKVDVKWQNDVAAPNLERIYDQYHGPDPEGLARLKAAALTSPMPPPDFTIESAPEIAQRKQAAFETKFPEIALWMRIKAQLSGAGGEEYFTTGLKDSALPRLRGVIVTAKPLCRPNQLLVAVKVPEQATIPPAEIALKLDKPLSGAVVAGAEFGFEGVPSAFTPNPFLLTMAVGIGQIDGLDLHACAPQKK